MSYFSESEQLCKCTDNILPQMEVISVALSIFSCKHLEARVHVLISEVFTVLPSHHPTRKRTVALFMPYSAAHLHSLFILSSQHIQCGFHGHDSSLLKFLKISCVYEFLSFLSFTTNIQSTIGFYLLNISQVRTDLFVSDFSVFILLST